MAGQTADNVSFVSVLKSYPPGEKLEVAYSLHDNLKSVPRDWVGLFRVGWSSSRDYYTFEWASTPNEQKGAVIFAGRRLPPEDKHFYQFCYVSSDGRVLGASSPFQFSSTAASVEDLELVEISEDSLMIIQPKEASADDASSSGFEKELFSVKESVSKLEADNEELVAKYEIVEEDGAKKLEQIETLEEKVADLEKQLQAKRDSETRLMEKLEKGRSTNHELTATKESNEKNVLFLQQKLEEHVALLASTQVGNEEAVKNLKEANHKLQMQVQDLVSKVEKATKDLDQLGEVEIELMTQIGEKNEVIDSNETEKNKMVEDFAEDVKGLRAERDLILQELSIAQENIAELVGAKKAGVVISEINISGKDQEPPTLPPTGDNFVDKSAYDALQQAFENIEVQYYQGVDETKLLRSRLHDMKIQFDTSQVKIAELTKRIQRCTEEYTAKCKELFNVERQLESTSNSHLHAKLKDMEENQEQVTKSWERAIEELASRKEEIKKKDIKVAELDDKVANLEETLHVVQVEYASFQDKHDKVIQDKTAKMDQQEDTLATKLAQIKDLHAAFTALKKDKEKLQDTVDSLREQLGSLKRQTTRSPHERSCPICNTKFPGRVSQDDFEKHVQAHFQQFKT